MKGNPENGRFNTKVQKKLENNSMRRKLLRKNMLKNGDNIYYNVYLEKTLLFFISQFTIIYLVICSL